jgi:hypothetical protein
MTAIQIRDVPDRTREVLAAEARESGQSLSMYLRDVMVRQAQFIENRQRVDEIADWPGTADFSVDDVLEVLDAGRNR